MLFFHDEQVGLNLRLRGITELWFTSPEAGTSGMSSLEGYGRDGTLLLALTAADPARGELLWRTRCGSSETTVAPAMAASRKNGHPLDIR